jgi:CheY-like chemotaxis protein
MENAVTTEATSVSSAANSPCCLIVDDDAAICKALAFTLRKLGMETVEVESPEGVQTAIAAREPQLIFLDLGLGKAAGTAGALEVLAILARRGFSGSIQLMSGRALSVLDEVAETGRAAGLTMLPALTKPFRMGVVRDLAARLALPQPAIDTAITAGRP